MFLKPHLCTRNSRKIRTKQVFPQRPVKIRVVRVQKAFKRRLPRDSPLFFSVTSVISVMVFSKPETQRFLSANLRKFTRIFCFFSRSLAKIGGLILTLRKPCLEIVGLSDIYFRSAGSVTMKVVPWPSVLSTVISPPCCWAIHCAMARPSPTPDGEGEPSDTRTRDLSTR